MEEKAMLLSNFPKAFLQYFSKFDTWNFVWSYIGKNEWVLITGIEVKDVNLDKTSFYFFLLDNKAT